MDNRILYGGVAALVLIVIYFLTKQTATSTSSPLGGYYAIPGQANNQDAVALAQNETEFESNKLAINLQTLKENLGQVFSLERLKADENVTLRRLESEERGFFEANKTERTVSLASIRANERTAFASIGAASAASEREASARQNELSYNREIALAQSASQERQAFRLFESEDYTTERTSAIEGERIASGERVSNSSTQAGLELERIRGTNQVQAIQAAKKGEIKKALLGGLFGSLGTILRFV